MFTYIAYLDGCSSVQLSRLRSRYEQQISDLTERTTREREDWQRRLENAVEETRAKEQSQREEWKMNMKKQLQAEVEKKEEEQKKKIRAERDEQVRMESTILFFPASTLF